MRRRRRTNIKLTIRDKYNLESADRLAARSNLLMQGASKLLEGGYRETYVIDISIQALMDARGDLDEADKIRDRIYNKPQKTVPIGKEKK